MKNLRLTIFSLVSLIVVLLLLALRCFYLQYFKADHYLSVSAKQQQRFYLQKPQRGAILDCRGRVLAASEKIKTIFAEPAIIEDSKAVSNKLQPILNIGAHQICRLIDESKNPGFVKIKSPAEPNECRQAGKIYGIGVQTDWQRRYPAGQLASHVVGFTSTDGHGLEGIELQYDDKLKGSVGRHIFLTDVRRKPLLLKQQKAAVANGDGIILTIDSTIQQLVRAELKKQYENYQAESAFAIVAEPKTAAILAMVSLPDFDPDNTGSTDPNNFRNRVLTDQYEPGSIIKPIAAAIAIDDGVVTLDEKIYCEEGHYSGKGFGRIGEYGDHKFADLTVKEIIVHSSNIGMAKIGQRLGKDKLYKGLDVFGFGHKTGIDLPGEVTGLLRPPNKWTGYSVTRIPFGQEISATPLQVLRAYCMLANGGRSVQPFVVKATVDNQGNIITLKRPQPSIGFVVKPQVADWIIKEALTSVVNEGTGRRARLKKWQVFGKTGTANIAKKNEKGYSESDYVASFVAGAPAEDPRIVVLVSIYKPDIKLGKGYTGGTVAAPVAAKIIEKTLTYLEKNQL